MKKLLTLVIIIFYSNLIFGQSKYKHNRVTVFKDGTVFIEKSTTVKIKNNIATLTPLPFFAIEERNVEEYRYNKNSFDEISKRLILGTLKFSAPDNSIEEILLDSSTTSSNNELPFTSIQSLLEYNIGKKVKLTETDTENPITGEIEAILMDRIFKYPEYYNYITKVAIKNQSSLYFVNVDKIMNIEFLDTPIYKKLEEEKSKYKFINLKFNKNVANQAINISYLQKGMSWIPTYFIDIQEHGKGILKLEANLMNDIEDIEQAEFNFVVGVPSFLFSYVNSPLSIDQEVLQILSDLNNPPKESETTIQNIMSQRGNYSKANYNTNYLPQIEGFGEEDLFFYKKENLSVKNGGRMIVPLFEIPFTYQDIYSVQLNRNVQARLSYSSQEIKEQENTVWHSLKFKNTAAFPLTTGTVFFKKLNEDNLAVLSQNQFNYTPPNEFAIVEMTVSPDIWVQNNDNEIKREPVNSDKLVTIEAAIDIVNYKSKPITLQITREIEGELLTSDKNWVIKTGFYTARNKINTVSWNIEVPAGKVEKIKYSYKVLID